MPSKAQCPRKQDLSPLGALFGSAQPNAHFLSSSAQSLRQAPGVWGKRGTLLPPREELGLWLDRHGLDPGSPTHWGPGEVTQPLRGPASPTVKQE